jgi:bifunctional DNA-binding transcriptional regulator/antitoxin component of YhaV-PrlF toxin-antitoxin module
MPQVRVRDKHQITLPAIVARAANISVDDVLEVNYRDGAIILMTQHAKEKKRPSLMEFAGSMKGTYGRTTEERQAYLAEERKSWER